MGVIEPGGVIDVDTAVQRILTKGGALLSGDFNDQAVKGQLAIDITNAVLYINVGTGAATVWTVVGTQT